MNEVIFGLILLEESGTPVPSNIYETIVKADGPPRINKEKVSWLKDRDVFITNYTNNV